MTGDLDGVPFVAVAAGERAPWADLPLTCPMCGEPDLPLLDSVRPGLPYIKHCDGVWLRGDINL